MQTKLIAKVMSDRDDDVFYSVSVVNNGGGFLWFCSCPHNVYRNKKCKHIDRTKEALSGVPIEGVFLAGDIDP